MRNVVLDTNCLLVSISRRAKEYIVWRGIIEGKYNLCVTTEILEEYQEIISEQTTPEIGQNVIYTLLNLKNVKLITAHFRFGLITTDVDDNKFVDCAIAANAHFIVSNDKHFKELETIEFPKVRCINLVTFIKYLQT